MNTKMWTIVPAIGAVALVAGLAAFSNAADYPSKRITFVVGFAAGGFADSVARIVGEHLHKKLGQNVLVHVSAKRRIYVVTEEAPNHAQPRTVPHIPAPSPDRQL